MQPTSALGLLAVTLAVAAATPLSAVVESKVDQLANLVKELKEKNIQDYNQYTIKSAYSLGETKISQLVNKYGAALEPAWTTEFITSRQGARVGVVATSNFMEKAAFKQWLDEFKSKGVISEEIREAAVTHVQASQAAKFRGCLVVSFKPAGTKLSIGMM